MKRVIPSALFICAVMLLVASGAFAQLTPDLNQPTEKRAQTGMKFLSMSLDARAAGMGNAMASNDIGSSIAMFYNPASMGMMQSNGDAVFGRAEWIADINYSFGSIALRPAEGNYGVIGVNFMAVDYGDLQGTIRDSNPANTLGYLDTGTFSPQALAVGLGYSYAVSDRFSVGANVKYVRENLGSSVAQLQVTSTGQVTGVGVQEAETNVVAFDFGILYRTGFRSLNFGVAARNFAKDLTYVEESFELPLTFQLGLSMNLMDFMAAENKTHSLLLSVDAVRPRDFDEHLAFGAEYTLADMVSVRGGYAAPTEEEGISLGGGLHRKFGTSAAVRLDYAYTNFGVFNNVNRFTLSFAF